MSATDAMILPAAAPAGDGGLQGATTMLTSGTYQDASGVAHCIYPFGYPYTYPPVTTELHTHVSAPAQEKPHETVQRAVREIASAARALKDSAQAMGVPVDAGALEEAIVARLREALA